MIRFFKSLQPATMLIIPLVVLALWGQTALHLPVVTDEHSLPLWSFIARVFLAIPVFVRFLMMVSLISLEAIYFNRMVDRYEVLYKNSYFPALCFTLLVSCSSDALAVHPVHLVNLIFLRVLDKTFSLFKNEKPISALIDSSFLLALAALIYFPVLPFYLLLLLSVNLLRPFNWKELWISMIGFLLPFFYVCVYYFLTGGLAAFWESYFLHFRVQGMTAATMPFSALVLGGFLAVFMILSLLKLRGHYLKNVIRTRTYQQILLFFLLIGAGSLLFETKLTIAALLILAIPLALLYAYYFVSAKKRLWMYEVLIWLFAGLVVWNHF